MATEEKILHVPEEQVSAAEDVNVNQIEEPVAQSEEVPAVVEATEGKAVPQAESAARKNAVDEESDVDERGEVVDFSQEEAELAADAPEYDLGEEDEVEKEESDKQAAAESDYDLSGKSKAELVELFAGALANKPVQSLRRDADAIKVAFYKLHRADVEQAKNMFVQTGGNAEDFSAPEDANERRLKELFGEYRRKRDEFLAGLEQSKEINLKKKLAIIEELKELINSNETINTTFNAFRDLQQKWKETGVVPQANIKDLWETYNHHVENFYNVIKINKELRDLDLKRNYEAKVELCEQAEALMLEPSIVTAFHKLQKLHELWRETGPVAKEHKDKIWERFKEASSRINKQHQDYFEGLKEDQQKNLDLKTELCVKAEELASSLNTSRKDWNKASDKLIEIQKVWKTIGFAPKKDNAKIYERFRAACDKFFEAKRDFYLKMKSEMEHNLNLKVEICELAESLKESEEWKKTTDELIQLQKRWKEIGSVARRHSDAVWKRFRAACDHFFERKSKHFSTVDSEYDDNLIKKRALLEEIEAADIMAGGFEAIKDFQRRWSEIGFVPIKQKDAIAKRYKELIDKMFNTLRGSERDRQMDRFKGKVSSMKESGDRRLRFERDRLYNKVKQLEADIATLENNIGFFSKSKNAESMIRDVKEKIEKAKQEMTATIEKINLIDNQ